MDNTLNDLERMLVDAELISNEIDLIKNLDTDLETYDSSSAVLWFNTTNYSEVNGKLPEGIDLEGFKEAAMKGIKTLIKALTDVMKKIYSYVKDNLGSAKKIEENSLKKLDEAVKKLKAGPDKERYKNNGLVPPEIQVPGHCLPPVDSPKLFSKFLSYNSMDFSFQPLFIEQAIIDAMEGDDKAVAETMAGFDKPPLALTKSPFVLEDLDTKVKTPLTLGVNAMVVNGGHLILRKVSTDDSGTKTVSYSTTKQTRFKVKNTVEDLGPDYVMGYIESFRDFIKNTDGFDGASKDIEKSIREVSNLKSKFTSMTDQQRRNLSDTIVSVNRSLISEAKLFYLLGNYRMEYVKKATAFISDFVDSM